MLDIIFLLSILCQLCAMLLAARFFKENPSKKAWGVISLALLFMIFRRFMGLLRTTSVSYVPLEAITLIEELIGLSTSVLLLIGIVSLNSLFRFIRQSSEVITVSENKYRTIFMDGFDAIFLVNADGDILECNRTAISLLGIPEEVLKGKNILKLSHPDQTKETTARNIIAGLAEHSGKLALEWTLPTAAGKMISTEARASRIIVNGGEKILLFMRDITQEKESKKCLVKTKEYLEILFDSSPLPMFVLNPEGKVTLWNKACEELTSLKKTEVYGKRPNFGNFYPERKTSPPTLAELILERNIKEVLERFKSFGVSSYGNDPFAVTCESTFTKDGREKNIKIIAKKLFDRENNFLGVIQIAQDVTVEKTIERYLYQSQKMEALGRLAVGIAHDFRNLLMIIQGTVDTLLRKAVVNSPDSASLRDIRIAVERGASLCRQLMSFSNEKITDKDTKVVNVNSTIRGLDKFIRRIFPENIHVVLELDPHIKPVKAQPVQLDRVFSNLLVNAQEAMPSGGTIIIRTEEVNLTPGEIPPAIETPPGVFVKITIKDTGEGMDPEILQNIFEPFFSTRKSEGGHGLGLYVVYNEIKKMGGFIRVDSKKHFGTSFEILIPVTSESKAFEEKDYYEEKESSLEVGRKVILLVEDDHALRKVLVVALQSLGHKIRHVGSAKEALQVLEEIRDVEVVLTDLGLPDISGYDLVTEIKERWGEAITTIIMTGYANAEVTKKCADRNIPILRKPFNIAKFQDILASMCKITTGGVLDEKKQRFF